MSDNKLLEAKKLIQSKKYNEARQILKDSNNPTAKKWLKKLDEIAPTQSENDVSQNSPLLLYSILTGVLGVVIGIIIGFVIGRSQVSTTSLADVPSQNTQSNILNDSDDSDDMRNRVIEGLQTYCFVPIDLLQAFDSWSLRNNDDALFPQLVSADVSQICLEWANEIVVTRYDAAEYCRIQGDEEFRDETFFECLNERNFHLGLVLGDGWASTAYDLIELEQGMKEAMGIAPWVDMRTTDIQR